MIYFYSNMRCSLLIRSLLSRGKMFDLIESFLQIK